MAGKRRENRIDPRDPAVNRALRARHSRLLDEIEIGPEALERFNAMSLAEQSAAKKYMNALKGHEIENAAIKQDFFARVMEEAATPGKHVKSRANLNPAGVILQRRADGQFTDEYIQLASDMLFDEMFHYAEAAKEQAQKDAEQKKQDDDAKSQKEKIDNAAKTRNRETHDNLLIAAGAFGIGGEIAKSVPDFFAGFFTFLNNSLPSSGPTKDDFLLLVLACETISTAFGAPFKFFKWLLEEAATYYADPAEAKKITDAATTPEKEKEYNESVKAKAEQDTLRKMQERSSSREQRDDSSSPYRDSGATINEVAGVADRDDIAR